MPRKHYVVLLTDITINRNSQFDIRELNSAPISFNMLVVAHRDHKCAKWRDKVLNNNHNARICLSMGIMKKRCVPDSFLQRDRAGVSRTIYLAPTLLSAWHEHVYTHIWLLNACPLVSHTWAVTNGIPVLYGLCRALSVGRGRWCMADTAVRD